MPVVVEQARGADLALCLAIRRRVFVEGQGVPEALEIDGLDDDSTHFLARQDGEALGTARLRAVDGSAVAQRVAVLDRSRGRGIGRALMEALEASARDAGLPRVQLHAQLEAVPFYQRLGYAPRGAVFEEAGIPHLAMEKSLTAAAPAAG